MVLKNVPKKYLIGKIVTWDKDHIGYYRENLPQGPEFRMIKTNIRWIITGSGEVMDISEAYDPNYQWRDSTILFPKPVESVPIASPKSVPSVSNPEQEKTSLEFNAQPPSNTQVNPVQQKPQGTYQSDKYQSVNSGDNYPKKPRNNFFTIGFGIGGNTFRLQNFGDLKVTPRAAYYFETGYLAFVGERNKIYLHPTLRILGKSVKKNYSETFLGLPRCL